MRLRLMQQLLLAAALVGVATAGQGYLFPQSACRVRCHNGGACAYDTEDPSIHSCICLVGVFEGDRCERLIPGAVDPAVEAAAAAAAAAAALLTTTTRAPEPPTPSAYEIELRRREEERARHMEERRKHDEERARMEAERARIMEERAKQEAARRAEIEMRGRDDAARRRAMEEDHRRRGEEERRQAEERRLAEERRVAIQQRAREDEVEARRREQLYAHQQNSNQQSNGRVPDNVLVEPTHKLDYDDYEDSTDGAQLEEVAAEPNRIEEDEDIDRIESAEMEKPDDDDEDEEEAAMTTTTPAPTQAVTYQVEDDYVTSTTPALTHDKAAHEDTSRMSGEDDDYFDHTPQHPTDASGNKVMPLLPGESDEDVVRGTQVDQTGRTVDSARPSFSSLDEEEDDPEEGESGSWMMEKKKQTGSSSSHAALTTLMVALIARWLL